VVLPVEGAVESEKFLLRLREAGWVEGRNLVIDRRLAPNATSLEEGLRAMVDARPDLILVGGSASAIAARRATAVIPIVFSMGADPVALGLVKTLAHPGGNATGLYLSLAVLETKRLSLLRELMPGIERVAVLHDSRSIYWQSSREGLEAAFLASAIKPSYLEVTSSEGIDGAVEQAAAYRAQAVLLSSDIFWYVHRDSLLDAARRRRLPVVAADTDVAQAGALLSYIFDEEDSDRIILDYADKVLRGARPNDLPVQEPRKFVLSINVTSAKSLGISIPQSILARADRVFR